MRRVDDLRHRGVQAQPGRGDDLHQPGRGGGGARPPADPGSRHRHQPRPPAQAHQGADTQNITVDTPNRNGAVNEPSRSFVAAGEVEITC